eukprot:3077286-Pleurochrysis_carterae.AAC.2
MTEGSPRSRCERWHCVPLSKSCHAPNAPIAAAALKAAMLSAMDRSMQAEKRCGCNDDVALASSEGCCRPWEAKATSRAASCSLIVSSPSRQIRPGARRQGVPRVRRRHLQLVRGRPR